MGRAFVHIGVSRSGTTTLQRNVFERLERIHYLGKTGEPQKGCSRANRSGVATALFECTLGRIVIGRSYSPDDLKKLRTSLEKLRECKAPVVYSNEFLAQNKYVSFASVAAGIHNVFGESELIVTVRDPQTALPSQYLWELAQISETRRPFTKWLDDAIANPRRIGRIAESLEQYRYASMLEQLRSAFSGRITILQYEDLVARPADFARSLGRLLGVEPEAIASLLRLPAQNVTRSGAWYCYRRLLHKFRSSAPFGLSSSPFARKLDAIIEVALQNLPKKQLAVSDYDRARIAHFFPYRLDEQDS